MTKKQYTYDYPEQRKLANNLIAGDIKFIAKETGYKPNTISKMCTGIRKMNKDVEKVIKEKLLPFRKNELNSN